MTNIWRAIDDNNAVDAAAAAAAYAYANADDDDDEILFIHSS